MVIKYFAPKLLYIEGANNIVADAFSRLEVSNTKPQKKAFFLFSKILGTNNQTSVSISKEENQSDVYLAALHDEDTLPKETYTLKFKTI